MKDMYITKEEFEELLDVNKEYSVPNQAVVDYQKVVIGSYLIYKELFNKDHIVWIDEEGNKLTYSLDVPKYVPEFSWRNLCKRDHWHGNLSVHISPVTTENGTTFDLETVYTKVWDFIDTINKKYSKKYGVRYIFRGDRYWTHTYLFRFHGIQVDNLPMVFNELGNKEFIKDFKIVDSITNMKNHYVGNIKPGISKIIECFKNKSYEEVTD